MYAKLKSKGKRESYLATLTTDEEEKKKKRQTREKPFDPHSVASALTIEDQKRAQEMRRYLEKGGIISPELVQSKDVNIEGIRINQYRPHPKMQGDMDRMASEAESSVSEGKGERTPQEWREELRKTIEGEGNNP